MKRPKRPRDFAQLAKFVVDIATGQRPDDSPKKNKAARRPAPTRPKKRRK